MTDRPDFDPGVTATPCAPEALLRLDLWRRLPDSELPPLGHATELPHGRVLGIEPAAWLLRTELSQEARAGAWLTELAGDRGGVIVVTGGLTRFRLAGPRWRELLTINAVFDVEDAAFGPGRVAGTILNHAAIWIDVITDTWADVYCLPSYAEHLAAGWRHAIGRWA